jgi:hypothetical protein
LDINEISLRIGSNMAGLKASAPHTMAAQLPDFESVVTANLQKTGWTCDLAFRRQIDHGGCS